MSCGRFFAVYKYVHRGVPRLGGFLLSTASSVGVAVMESIVSQIVVIFAVESIHGVHFWFHFLPSIPSYLRSTRAAHGVSTTWLADGCSDFGGTHALSRALRSSRACCDDYASNVLATPSPLFRRNSPSGTSPTRLWLPSRRIGRSSGRLRSLRVRFSVQCHHLGLFSFFFFLFLNQTLSRARRSCR